MRGNCWCHGADELLRFLLRETQLSGGGAEVFGGFLRELAVVTHVELSVVLGGFAYRLVILRRGILAQRIGKSALLA